MSGKSTPPLATLTREPPQAVLEALRQAKRPLLLTHIYPDGDGIGSQLGLARAFQSRGAEPHIINAHEAPKKLAFLDPDESIQVIPGSLEPQHQMAIDSADLILILDTSDPERLGHLRDPVLAASAQRIAVDHHLSHSEDAFDMIWSEPDCPATGVMVQRILEEFPVSLTAELATPLLVAIGTDTGWFRFANATPEAFASAARLVAAGANAEELYTNIYETSTPARTRMQGEVMAGLQSHEEGRILYGIIRGDQLRHHGVGYEEIDGIIDTLKAVQGGEILFLVVELSKGRYKVSLRSKGDRDVYQIAAQFGGGGHAKAAGCRLEADEKTVIGRILDAARQALAC
ncbi:MAG: DHH family phosphoesterase [Planctomycetota bacterium]